MGQVLRQRHEKSLVQEVDRGRMIARAILTFPQRDYDGDLVEPAGGVWDETPYVNHEHNELNLVGRGSVQLVKESVTGKSLTLPMGTTHFYQKASDLPSTRPIDPDTGRRCNDSQYLTFVGQVFRLVDDGKMLGVSLEYQDIESKSLGVPSPRQKRSGRHFTAWKGLGWAHTFQPVNTGALLCEKAISVYQTGRVGDQPLHGIIKKSLSQYMPQGKSNTVKGNWSKAMDDDMNGIASDATAAADTDAGLAPEDTGETMKPSPKYMVAFAQGLKDLVAAARELEKGADDKESLAFMEEKLAAAEALSEEVLAAAQDMHPDAGVEPPEPDGDEAYPEPAEDEMLAQDDDGALVGKSFKKGFGVRFKLASLTPVKPVEPTPAEKKALALAMKKLDRLERQYGRR